MPPHGACSWSAGARSVADVARVGRPAPRVPRCARCGAAAGPSPCHPQLGCRGAVPATAGGGAQRRDAPLPVGEPGPLARVEARARAVAGVEPGSPRAGHPLPRPQPMPRRVGRRPARMAVDHAPGCRRCCCRSVGHCGAPGSGAWAALGRVCAGASCIRVGRPRRAGGRHPPAAAHNTVCCGGGRARASLCREPGGNPIASGGAVSPNARAARAGTPRAPVRMEPSPHARRDLPHEQAGGACAAGRDAGATRARGGRAVPRR